MAALKLRIKLAFVLGVALVLVPGCRRTSAPTPTVTAEGLTEADAMSSAEDFLALLLQNDYSAATDMFDPAMRNALPTAKVQEVWSALIGQAGDYHTTLGRRTERQGRYLVVVLTLELARLHVDMRVVLDVETAKISGLFFAPSDGAGASPVAGYDPPPYVDLRSFSEVEVIVGDDEWALPGTLSLPNRPVPVPAVILVHGSGPNDRDQAVGGNKTFRDLAGGLASRGIAVLRYDKRTLVHGARMLGETITVQEEVIDDALAAIRLLRGRAELDPAQVFVLGHSLGGMLAPRIAALDVDLAGVIVLAGPSRPLEDLVLAQVKYLAELDGQVSDQEKEQVEEVAREVEAIKSLDASDSARKDMILSAPVSYWLDLKQYDPVETARTLRQPLLFLQGERDYQVTMADWNGWRAGLAQRKGVQFRSYPLANHLFVNGEGVSTPQEYEAPGHIAAEVIEDIAQWIRVVITGGSGG